MSENGLFLSGEENEKPESTRISGSPPKVNLLPCLPSLVDVRFRVRELFCLQNDRTNKRMTENDHQCRINRHWLIRHWCRINQCRL